MAVSPQIHQLGKDAGVEATIGRRKLNHFFLGETLRIKMAKQHCNAVKACAVRILKVPYVILRLFDISSDIHLNLIFL